MFAPPYHLRRCSGFSLVELLVGIAVIAVLIAFSLVGVGQMRERGNAVKCLGNLRQIAIAMEGYLGEHNRAYPQQDPYMNTSQPTWWGGIAPYLNWPRPLSANPNAAKGTIGHCPSHMEQPGSFSYVGNSFFFTDPSQPPVRAINVVFPQRKLLIYEVHTASWWPPTGIPTNGTGKAPFIPAYSYGAHGKATAQLYADGHAALFTDDGSSRGWADWNPGM